MKLHRLPLTILVIASLFSSCGPKKETAASKPSITITSRPFAADEEGRAIIAYTIANAQGMSLTAINYGGIVTELMVPDKNGNVANVALGLDSLHQYQKASPYFGAIIGRYGNRIANGEFTLDNVQYSLAKNNGPNTLHGGNHGFDKQFWDVTVPVDSTTLVFTYTSLNGEEGYPGTLTCKVTYSITNDNEWIIDYHATTDEKTIVNLTQHTYFNLSGNPNSDILDHELQINADNYLPVDATLIPVGAPVKVEGTPFDFRTATAVGARIGEDNEQLKMGGGYDHCWVLNGGPTDTPRMVATVVHPTTSRKMEVFTTEPGIQFYSGNFLDGSLSRKGGITYKHRSGLCLETQHYPDSPNKPDYPSVVLSPDDTYHTTTIYKFSTISK